jgi:hypothetical protein
MWIATDRGFYSVVAHRAKLGHVLIRGRARVDLERLQPLLVEEGERAHEIVYTPTADYPYRIYAPATAWERAAVRLCGGVDYPNFKDAVKERQGGARAAVYMRVWQALRGIEIEDPQLATQYEPLELERL